MDKNEIHAKILEMVTPLCQAKDIDVWGIELLFGAGAVTISCASTWTLPGEWVLMNVRP